MDITQLLDEFIIATGEPPPRGEILAIHLASDLWGQLMFEQDCDGSPRWKFTHRGVPVLHDPQARAGTVQVISQGDLPSGVPEGWA